MRANTAETWLQQRIAKYGPVSKMSLFGRPTVFIHAQAANKFLFTTGIAPDEEPHVQHNVLSDEEHRRDKLMECFEKMIAGKWSVPPVNLPFTPYNRSIKESKKVQHMIKEFISEKTAELEQKNASPLQALVACWLNTRNDDNEEALAEMRTCTISF
ncbi:hypothetical protein DVH24_004184 [Malus domestica]|uniref:Uncharacterized protein n=1 Tax=Malus domestica TaxID=3750 RepID=A0A498KDG8_MALDO|nr:hypothetical protein DVH24_004184 [Malus domestica]